MSNTNDVKRLDVSEAMVSGVVSIVKDELYSYVGKRNQEIANDEHNMITAVCAGYRHIFTEAVEADKELGGGEETGAYTKVIHDCNLLVAEIEDTVGSLLDKVLEYTRTVEDTLKKHELTGKENE